MKFQFSIRDLLMIVAIVALAAGWWIDHQRINKMTVQQWEFMSKTWWGSDSELTNIGDGGWEGWGACQNPNARETILLFKRPKR